VSICATSQAAAMCRGKPSTARGRLRATWAARASALASRLCSARTIPRAISGREPNITGVKSRSSESSSAKSSPATSASAVQPTYISRQA
jgi:hypothetical protein